MNGIAFAAYRAAHYRVIECGWLFRSFSHRGTERLWLISTRLGVCKAYRSTLLRWYET